VSSSAEEINFITDPKSFRPKIKFIERHDAPAFCLVKAICGMAFRDGAFASEWIREPEDIYGIKIPDRLHSVPIEWAAEWKQTPVFRRTVRDVKGNIETSPTLAAQYHQLATWNLRLGKSFGLKEPFEFKTLRRAAAAVLPGKCLSRPCQPVEPF
jgi:Protein of unknown function (DUF3435)